MIVSLEKYPDSFFGKYASSDDEEILIDLDFKTLNNIMEYISYNIPVNDRIKTIMDYLKIPHKNLDYFLHLQ